MAIPTFDLTRAPPGKMRMPHIVSGGIEGGRSLSGVDTVTDMTGGGLVQVSYGDIGLGNINPARQRYWSQLAGILNSRVRSIIVPLFTDFIVPGGFSAVLTSAAQAGTGTIGISLSGVRPTDEVLAGGEWFEIVNPVTLNRVHVITDIDQAVRYGNGTATLTVGIAPPLREAAQANQALNFIRPKCLMRLAPGAIITSDVDSAFWTTPDVDFIESFGVV